MLGLPPSPQLPAGRRSRKLGRDPGLCARLWNLRARRGGAGRRGETRKLPLARCPAGRAAPPSRRRRCRGVWGERPRVLAGGITSGDTHPHAVSWPKRRGRASRLAGAQPRTSRSPVARRLREERDACAPRPSPRGLRSLPRVPAPCPASNSAVRRETRSQANQGGIRGRAVQRGARCSPGHARLRTRGSSSAPPPSSF